MALIKLGPTVVDIRGTVGGLTFSRSKPGSWVRPWSRPVDPKEPRQQLSRVFQGATVRAWSNLSPAHQLEWDLFAADPQQELFNRFGEPYQASGFQWFVMINRWRRTVGQGITNQPPPSGRPNALENLELHLGQTQDVPSYIEWTNPVLDDDFCIIQLRLFFSLGRRVAHAGFRIAAAELLTSTTEFFFDSNARARDFHWEPPWTAFVRAYRQTLAGYRSIAATATDRSS